jgi:hypothetical protein
MLHELALEGAPRLLTYAPIPTVDVLQEALHELVHPLVIAQKKLAGGRQLWVSMHGARRSTIRAKASFRRTPPTDGRTKIAAVQFAFLCGRKDCAARACFAAPASRRIRSWPCGRLREA